MDQVVLDCLLLLSNPNKWDLVSFSDGSDTTNLLQEPGYVADEHKCIFSEFQFRRKVRPLRIEDASLWGFCSVSSHFVQERGWVVLSNQRIGMVRNEADENVHLFSGSGQTNASVSATGDFLEFLGMAQPKENPVVAAVSKLIARAHGIIKGVHFF